MGTVIVENSHSPVIMKCARGNITLKRRRAVERQNESNGQERLNASLWSALPLKAPPPRTFSPQTTTPSTVDLPLSSLQSFDSLPNHSTPNRF
ncbi:hypothetical protein BDV95DRAFT_13281 [Massariosphaeria phaeospora]|uniref:Uncharacterized protein n=1 Tax=Massariosphaeria phaeospora TaxID=100035 RepID=A0A7C8IJU2_9PLEO|nr:hypothetical protein BDV95DRAFT_13281 [Massariosphaeria phaeospora]